MSDVNKPPEAAACWAISRMQLLTVCRAHLNAAAAHWHLCRLSLDIVDRARRPFPAEPVRTLDAIHLASALAVRSTVPRMELLSLDDRIRRAAEQLGFRLQPG
jgi:hypothetical protein